MGMPLGKSPCASQRGIMHGDPLCSAVREVGKATHVCSQLSPVPSTGTSLAQAMFLCQRWLLAPCSDTTTRSARLITGGCCVSPLCIPVGCAGGCSHPLWGLPVTWNPGINSWDGHSWLWQCCRCHRGVPILRVPILKVPRLYSWWTPVWGRFPVLKEREGWGPWSCFPAAPSVGDMRLPRVGVCTWSLPGKVIG